VVLIEQWIDGVTLKSFLRSDRVTPAFLLAYVRGMCGALGVLSAKGYRHDDLRPENVMIEPPVNGDVAAEARVKVIDTGSMKDASAPLRKAKDDHRWFSEHLLLIRNAMRERQPLALHDARFIKEIDPLLDRMFEDDRTAALWAPGRVEAEFVSAWSRAIVAPSQSLAKLNNPFDYIAAEHIVSDELLVRLFADSCPWFGEVAGPNPLLLTGPRGCGKSTVFRRLSLKALLFKSPEEISASQIVVCFR
jgi:serine/threonine protein kinase